MVMALPVGPLLLPPAWRHSRLIAVAGLRFQSLGAHSYQDCKQESYHQSCVTQAATVNHGVPVSLSSLADKKSKWSQLCLAGRFDLLVGDMKSLQVEE